MSEERPLTIMSSRVMTVTVNPTYSASEDKENVDPLGPGHHRDALLRRPAENMASRIQLYSHLNGQANSPKGGKPKSNPEPIPAKPRRRRYPLQDITAIVYPGQVNLHTGAGYGSNPRTHIPFPGRPPYQHASPRLNVAKRKASVSSLKKQAAINSKAKNHFGNHCLEPGERAEHTVQDSISTQSEKKDTIKEALQNNALIIRRRQLRRATNHIEIRKAKAQGYFPV